jgi:alkaline phosphatase
MLIAAQVIESGVPVILAGGEAYLLPEGTAGRHGEGTRTDGRNLIEEATAAGYTVVYTREELLALDTATTDKVLGVFAADHTFHDQDFERNQVEGLPHYVETAPTIGEMAEVALQIVSRDPEGFFVVVEEEGTDNMSNNMNAAGALEALRRADEAVGVIHGFVEGRNDTLMVMAADSDAGGLQVLSGSEAPEGEQVAATTDGGGILLGQQGRHGDVFMSAPDAQGVSHAFGIAYVGYNDVAGGILVRAAGLNADRVEPLMDNTEVYRLMYETLFGTLPSQ